jgi:hypothetical protein
LQAKFEIQNSDGFDRIPQRILIDGADMLSLPLHNLMKLIYDEMKITDQWLVTITIPVYNYEGNQRISKTIGQLLTYAALQKYLKK